MRRRAPDVPTLDWIGKQAVLNHHRQVPYHLLKCDRKLSVGDPGSGNLLVEGDNLLALKALLPYYAGQVKCIYIDPPYNTGNEDWTYNDAVNSPEMRNWLGKAVGNEAEDLSRHDKWLCMMYPRLQLLQQFLASDGVVFISIDEEEIGNLIALCDEVFGRRNRLAIFSWVRKKKGSNLSKEFRKTTEHVVAYKRSWEKIVLFGAPAYAEKQVPLLNRANKTATVKFPAGVVKAGRGLADGNISAGEYGRGELTVKLEDDIRIVNGVVATPFSLSGRFRWTQSTVDGEIKNGSVFTASRTFRINVARYNQAEKFKAPTSLLSQDDGIGTNEDATEELRRLFPEREKLPFDFPKPTSLIKHLVRSVCKNSPGSLVLDSFAGSGTTGHAVLALNKDESLDLRFILVEMEADVCLEVTSQRLARAIRGYAGNGTGRRLETEVFGGGFRFCTLGPPLFDEKGSIADEVRFPDLAAHVYFAETGEPLPKRANGKSGLLGVHNGTAVYLLYNGVLGDRSVDGGNVLTGRTLAALPPHDGPRVIYGEGCRFSPARLKRERVTFRQIPYEIKVG